MFSPTVLLPPSPSHFSHPPSSHFSSFANNNPPFGVQEQGPLASPLPPSSSRKRSREDDNPFVFQRTPPQKKRFCDSQRFVLKGSRKRKRPGEDFGVVYMERPEFSDSDLPLHVLNPHKRVRPTPPEFTSPSQNPNDERSLVLYGHTNQNRSLVLYGQQRRQNTPPPAEVQDRSLIPFGTPRWNSNVNYQAFTSPHLSRPYPNPTHDIILYRSQNQDEEASSDDSLMRDID